LKPVSVSFQRVYPWIWKQHTPPSPHPADFFIISHGCTHGNFWFQYELLSFFLSPLFQGRGTPFTIHQSPITNHHLQFPIFASSSPSHFSLFTSHQSPIPRTKSQVPQKKIWFAIYLYHHIYNYMTHNNIGYTNKLLP
jgi:hypothetical protein